MIRVTQVNMSTPRNKEWLCCFGLHVRTATIIIGTWHLVSKIEWNLFYTKYNRNVFIDSLFLTLSRSVSIFWHWASSQ